MNLKDLFNEIEIKSCCGDLDRDYTEVVYDSRKITEGCVFVCVKGAKFDGHLAINEAFAKKAAAVLIERKLSEIDCLNRNETCIVEVSDTRFAMAYLAARVNDYPSRKLKMIGITGTKGKTTTTYLIKSILENAGYKVGLIGTIEIIIGNKHIKAVNTTPESYILQGYLKQMVDEGIEIVVMEVSSQALMLHRTAAIEFDLGIFTNLESDHIGPNEHTSFEHYMQCKSILFKQCKIGIVNGDDANVDNILRGATCLVEKYGLNPDNNLYASNISLYQEADTLGVTFDSEGLVDIDGIILEAPGKFSVYNGLCALAVCRHFDITPNKVREALKNAKVKGRIEIVKVKDNCTVMIDYAHNAMALESLLVTLKEYNPKRLVCLFGCGGNRSKERRYLMGEVSGRLADLTVITSDNPRDEEPRAIIEDIKIGIRKTDGAYVEIPDRIEAINYVVNNAIAGDVIVLAGKGHEDYQEIKGVKYPMDEREILKKIAINNAEQ